MKSVDYENADVLNCALNRICRFCKYGDCSGCTVYKLRTQSIDQQAFREYCKTTQLPDTFAFQSLVNQLTIHDTYFAVREEDYYGVSIPRIGEICKISVVKMEECVRNSRFRILKVPSSYLMNSGAF